MKKVILICAGLLAFAIQHANAGQWSVSGAISTGVQSTPYAGAVYGSAPVYSYAPGCYSSAGYVPAPAPAPVVVYSPPPVYYAPPAPVVVYRPAYVIPAPVIGISLNFGGGHHRRCW